jgi:hypothetical protein
MTATMTRWLIIEQKCAGWRSFSMGLKYGMSHAWTTVMPII